VIRIISGTHKGRRLKAPGSLPVRPTSDRTKEALFNILGHETYWPETTVLDLFAGTGNLSYECGSRGSPSIVAVDSHRGCVRFIEKTSELLGLPITVYKRDVMAFLKQPAGTFDLIFADPPYDFSTEMLAEIVALCLDDTLLAEDGKLIVEHSADRDLSGLPDFEQARKYGGTVFSFFSRKT
jgi:16S rRNA (guanine(966)-N(2))-methyltransferase RsmD